jgi:NADH dehydrogenase [ubiquinone] 1 alpha subcomplex assembly factor 5
MNQPQRLFDRARVRTHRDRAAPAFSQYDFLLRELAFRMADRLPDIRRTFPTALELGAHTGSLAEYLGPEAGIETLIQSDLSAALVTEAPGLRLVADEEFLPFAPASFDLVMSVFSLHWINDLPGTLVQVFRCLKPGGLFLAMLPGGETLKELRAAFEQAEMRITGGLSPRISPFVDVKDAGSLLQRAGFTLPVTDSEILTISYENPLKLLADLRGMGESSALLSGLRHFTRRSVIFAALDYYQRQYAEPSGRMPATFEVVTMTAWKPDAPKA